MARMYLPFENGLSVSIIPLNVGVEVTLLGKGGEIVYDCEPIPQGVVQLFNGESLTSLLLNIQNAQGL